MLLPAYPISMCLIAPPMIVASVAPPATVAPKVDPAIVEYKLQWIKQTLPVAIGDKPGEPVLLSSPATSSIDRQLLTISTGDKNGDSFALSLSPTVERADNFVIAPGGETVKKTGATVLTLWTLKVSDKAFPGNVCRVELSGSTRLALGDGKDAVIASFGLSDPKTGVTTQYRLIGRARIGDVPRTP